MIRSTPYLTDPPLHLSYLPGREACLVISFSGVGTDHLDTPPVEGAGMAGEGGANHVLFVSDASRSWMNHPGLMARLKAAVSQLTEAIKPTRIVAIGNSMGGSAALIYAAEAPVDAVLAIAPQYSVHPGVMPQETRWTGFTEALVEWPYPAVPDLSGRGVDVVILHGTGKREMPHARRIVQGANVDHYLFRSFGHGMAARLKRTNRLQPISAPFIAGDLPAARRAIRAAGGVPFHEFNRPRLSAQASEVPL